MGVASHLATTPAEMEQYVKGRGAIGDYLSDLVQGFEHNRGTGWSKILWDVATVAWMIDPAWVPTHLVHAPIAQEDGTWSTSNRRHFIRQAYWVRRDRIYRDLFQKITAHAS
jgi:hypothetical protein